MPTRIDRRTALTVALVLVFGLVTALPWRSYRAFDPTSVHFVQHRATAWTDSGWWLTAAVFGIAAGICLLLPRRPAGAIGAAAAALAVLAWSLRAWQLHHPAPVRPTTVAIANFPAGAPIVRLGQPGLTVGSYLAVGLLVLMLILAGVTLLGSPRRESTASQTPS